MYTHPLTELLKSFDKKELMRLGKYLNSPYFNNRKMLVRLFNILKRYHPDFDNKNFEKEKIFSLLYKNIKYNDSTFRNLMSDLLKLVKNFLKEEGIKKKEIESSFYLTHELFSRGSVNLFMNEMSRSENLLENRDQIDGEYFINKFRIETDRFYLNLLTQKVLKKSYVTSESEKLIKGITFILCYFVIESVKHNDILLKYSRSYNINKNIDTVKEFLELFNFEKIIHFFNKHSGIKVPIIEIYHKLLKTFLNLKNEKEYLEFKNLLIESSKNLGIIDNNFLHSKLIDYCILKKNLGETKQLNLDREIFKLHDIFLKNEYFKTDINSYLTFDLYRNVLLNCISVKELKYMEDFIAEYSKKLIPQHIQNVENYSYALLYFEKKQFLKALNYLNKVKFDQFVYKLDMKNLQLKINYELEYFESAISIIDTYKHFLKNNQLISESRKELHKNFISYSQKLIKLRTDATKSGIIFFREKLLNASNVFDKNWLLEKNGEIFANFKKNKVA
ncbi:MAG: hypothetical protein HGGPFJEG_00532 [Ignavibacteria bacterium]|nr:hypothetical protein [Ignavibacteria bacterium]